MIRKISACALLVTFLATPAFSQSMDCEQEFRVRVNKMMGKPDIRMPINDMVASTRFMIQGYDACMKGDMTGAKSFFEQAGKYGN